MSVGLGKQDRKPITAGPQAPNIVSLLRAVCRVTSAYLVSGPPRPDTKNATASSYPLEELQVAGKLFCAAANSQQHWHNPTTTNFTNEPCDSQLVSAPWEKSEQELGLSDSVSKASLLVVLLPRLPAWSSSSEHCTIKKRRSAEIFTTLSPETKTINLQFAYRS